jgi:hypothetical protein
MTRTYVRREGDIHHLSPKGQKSEPNGITPPKPALAEASRRNPATPIEGKPTRTAGAPRGAEERKRRGSTNTTNTPVEDFAVAGRRRMGARAREDHRALRR